MEPILISVAWALCAAFCLTISARHNDAINLIDGLLTVLVAPLLTVLIALFYLYDKARRLTLWRRKPWRH